MLEKPARGAVLVSLKGLLHAAAPTAPRVFSDLVEGQTLVGHVRSVTSYGVFVAFVHGLFGLVPIKSLGNHFVTDPAAEFSVGQTVVTTVVGLEYDSKRVVLSMVRAVESSIEAPRLRLERYFAERAALAKKTTPEIAALKIGDIVTATVANVRPVGALLTLPGGSNAFVVRSHIRCVAFLLQALRLSGLCLLLRNFSGDLKEGAPVTGVVLDIDLNKNIADISLREELLAVFNGGKKAKKVATTGPATVELVKVALFRVGFFIPYIF